MSLALDKRPSEFSWSFSVLAHVLLLVVLAFQTTAPLPKPKILTIETVAGLITPRGSGSGAVGEGNVITDQPAPSPLAPVFNMDISKIKPTKVEQPKPQPPKPEPAKAPERPKPNLAEERAALSFPDVRAARPVTDTPVEGMGAGAKAGTSQGSPTLSGSIAGRGWRGPDSWMYNRDLPEETALVLQVLVKPNGLVSKATIIRTSGFREIDEYYLAKARELVFDPLPIRVEQVDEVGELTFRFNY